MRVYNGPPFDPEEIKAVAAEMISRYGSKKRAEREAMDRQNKQPLATPGTWYWAAVAQAIRNFR
jgi:hypothetical protein